MPLTICRYALIIVLYVQYGHKKASKSLMLSRLFVHAWCLSVGIHCCIRGLLHVYWYMYVLCMCERVCVVTVSPSHPTTLYCSWKRGWGGQGRGGGGGEHSSLSLSPPPPFLREQKPKSQNPRHCRTEVPKKSHNATHVSRMSVLKNTTVKQSC